MRTPPTTSQTGPARHWGLAPRITYLNHGSYGACPTAVLEAQARWRDLMEADAVSFFARGLFEMLDRSRLALAAEFGGQAENYVFCRNATTAVETILENVARGHGLADPRPLGPGDELLAFDHEYRACLNNLDRLADRTGAKVVQVTMPLDREGGPPIDGEQIALSLMAAVTSRTRVCLLSHITSASGAVLPVERIVRELEHRGVVTIVDAAHGPGAVMVDVTKLGCAFYTSNCHKWLCSPKGAAMLWVRPDLQAGFRPLVLSNHANASSFPLGAAGRSKFQMEFDYTGTDDYTAAGAVADALEIMPQIAGCDWAGIVERNHKVVLQGRDLLCDRLGVEAPYADALIGPMATLPLPVVQEAHRAEHIARPTFFADPLQDALLTNHGIQVPVWRTSGEVWDGRRYFRISAQLYNTIEQYDYLADALVEELDK